MANTGPTLPVLKPHNVNPYRTAPNNRAAPPLVRRPVVDQHIRPGHVPRNPGPRMTIAKENCAPISKTSCQVSRSNIKKETEKKLAFQPVTKVPVQTKSLKLCVVTGESKAKQEAKETKYTMKDKHLKPNVFLKPDPHRNQIKSSATNPVNHGRTVSSQIVQAGKGNNGKNQKLTLIATNQRLVNKDNATLLKQTKQIDDVQDEPNETQNIDSSEYLNQTLDETFTVITEYIPLNKHSLWWLQPQKSSETPVSMCPNPQPQKSSYTHVSLFQDLQPQKSSDKHISLFQDPQPQKSFDKHTSLFHDPQPQKNSDTHLSLFLDPQPQKSSDIYVNMCQDPQPQKSSHTLASLCQDPQFQSVQNKLVQFEDEETDVHDDTAIECVNDTFNETVTEITEFYPYSGFHYQPLRAQTSKLYSPVQYTSVTTEKKHKNDDENRKNSDENSRKSDTECWNAGLGNMCVDDPLNETVTFVTEVFELCGPGHVGRLKEFEVVKVKSSGAKEVVSSHQPDFLCEKGAADEEAGIYFSSSTSLERDKQLKKDFCLLLDTDGSNTKAQLEERHYFPISSQIKPADQSNFLEHKLPTRTATLNRLQLDKMQVSQTSHSLELQTKIAEFKNQRWNLLQKQNQLASIREVRHVAEGNKQDGINLSSATAASKTNSQHLTIWHTQSERQLSTEEKSIKTDNFEERNKLTHQELQKLTLESHCLQPDQNKQQHQQGQGQQQQVQQPQQQNLQPQIEPATSATTSRPLSADVGRNTLDSEADKVDSYELSDEDWDEFEDDYYIPCRGASRKKIPEWATGVQLQSALIQQAASHQDLQHLFNMDNIQTPDLASVFQGSWRLRYKLRTSSAMWDPASAPLYK